MKNTPMCQMKTVEIRSALTQYIQTFDHCARETRQTYLGIILDFLGFMQSGGPRVAGYLFIDEAMVMDWLEHICTAHSVSGAIQRLETVAHFMAAMQEGGFTRTDPVAEIQKRYGARGRRAIINALCSPNPRAALDALRPQETFTGSFGQHAKSYLDLHRAAGEGYRGHELALEEFNRFLREHATDSITSVTPALLRAWHASFSCSQRHARNKVLKLDKFLRHALHLGLIRNNPVTRVLEDEILPLERPFRPYIFSQEQIATVIQEAMKLPSCRTIHLKAESMHMIFRLLYTLGLRLGEAVRLQIRDVDLDQGTLWVRKTKFYKERILPFGPRLAEHLAKYLELRRQMGVPANAEDPLFLGWRRIGRKREPINAVTVRAVFHDILKRVGIAAPPGRRRPRLHDLRHTFAVHRLLRWYRKGEDAQKRLVLLATFMGHSTIFSSQVYLTITGSLLNEANQRFQARFGNLAGKEQQS